MVSKLKMKLFFEKKKPGRLLFAEVQQDFVLFLLSVLTFPVRYFAEREQKNPMFGCIGNLYKSIDNLKDKSIEDRNKRLNLTTPFGRFLKSDANRQRMKFYTCSDGTCRLYFTDSHGSRCGKCKTKMTTECFYDVGDHGTGGGGYAYAVMDDLVLKPQSTMELLRKFGLNSRGDAVETEVEVEKAEVFKMVSASFTSKTVLTDRLGSCVKKA